MPSCLLLPPIITSSSWRPGLWDTACLAPPPAESRPTCWTSWGRLLSKIHQADCSLPPSERSALRRGDSAVDRSRRETFASVESSQTSIKSKSVCASSVVNIRKTPLSYQTSAAVTTVLRHKTARDGLADVLKRYRDTKKYGIKGYRGEQPMVDWFIMKIAIELSFQTWWR